MYRYYENTNQSIKVGDMVFWDSEDDIEGCLVDINDKNFTVDWLDCGKQVYPIDFVDQLRPL
jgi:hypothetical protein